MNNSGKAVAIAIDDWKLEIFERHLRAAGLTYEVQPGLVDDTLLIRVSAWDSPALKAVVTAANTEAQRSRAH